MRRTILVLLFSAVGLTRSAQRAHADNWGCDWVNTNSGLGVVDDCGSQGACCDAHDEDFRRYGCEAASWLHLLCVTRGLYCDEWSNCDTVNLQAAYCIQHQSPGAGVCCNFNGHNVCQEERNPNSWWGCNGDQFCSPNTYCDLAVGVCKSTSICTNTTPTACGVSWTDSCGNTYAPFACPDPLVCTDGRCVRPPCDPYTCDDYGQDGTFSDGCGGTINCFDGSCGDWDYDCYDDCTSEDVCSDPWDPGGGGGCSSSLYPPWCPYYCSDIALQ